MSSGLVSHGLIDATKQNKRQRCESSRVWSRVAPRSHAAQRLQEGPASRAVPTALWLRRARHERRVPHHHGPQGGEGLCAQSLHVSQCRPRTTATTACEHCREKKKTHFCHFCTSHLFFFLFFGGKSLFFGCESVSAHVLRDHRVRLAAHLEPGMKCPLENQ